jgi:DNA-binding GntR family transcriptional regulator
MRPSTEEANPTWGPGLRSVRTTPPNTLSTEAYVRLRADIVSGRLAPGVKLTTKGVKERYGIGGSPMREALTHLAADGLLETEGQKGFTVVSASIGELADIGRVRMQLELQALALAVKRGGVDWEVALVSQFHRLQHALESPRSEERYGDEWEQTHRAFHFALLSGCASPWLMHFCDRIYDQTERYRRLYTRYERIPAKLTRSHKALLDAALARDVEKSLALTRDHIAFATRQTLADMLAAGVKPDPAAEAAIGELQSLGLILSLKV